MDILFILMKQKAENVGGSHHTKITAMVRRKGIDNYKVLIKKKTTKMKSIIIKF